MMRRCLHRQVTRIDLNTVAAVVIDLVVDHPTGVGITRDADAVHVLIKVGLPVTATISFFPIEEFQKPQRVLQSAFISGFLSNTTPICKKMASILDKKFLFRKRCLSRCNEGSGLE